MPESSESEARGLPGSLLALSQSHAAEFHGPSDRRVRPDPPASRPGKAKVARLEGGRVSAHVNLRCSVSQLLGTLSLVRFRGLRAFN